MTRGTPPDPLFAGIALLTLNPRWRKAALAGLWLALLPADLRAGQIAFRYRPEEMKETETGTGDALPQSSGNFAPTRM